MSCIKNLSRINYPSDLVFKLTELYTYKGKDFHYEDVLKQYMNQIIKNTIERDTVAAAKILDLKVPDNRLKLLIKKDSTPKTKSEIIVKNLKKVFEIIQDKGVHLDLTDNEFLQLATKLFKDVDSINYRKDITIEQQNMLEEEKIVSRRDIMKEEIKQYNKAKYTLKVEPTQIITNFYVDILKHECFTKHNNFISLMICYCLLFSERFNVFKYISFFESYLNNFQEFQKYESESFFGWETGFAKCDGLNKKIIDVLLDGYERVEQMVEGFKFEKTIKKVDNVEGVIMKLGDVFSREDIKNKVPNLSDSTINRALKRLRDEGKIRPDGTGRTAKWIRIAPKETFTGQGIQMDIFDYME